MSKLVAVTAIGNDRPGIVAGVTRILFEKGCNLEDVTSTILRGHFSMVLIVHVPDVLDASTLEDALRPAARELGLVITARPVEETTTIVPSPTHVVSVYGADRPGIVYRVSQALADSGANVTDLTSRVIGPEDEPVYALILEVEVPGSADLEGALSELRSALGVEATANPIEPDLL